MSDSVYFTSKDALRDRYLRKMEVLECVAADSLLPWRKALSWLSSQENMLNKGNSLRTMKAYLEEHAYAGYGKFDGEFYKVTDSGIKAIGLWLENMSAYGKEPKFKPLSWFRQQLQTLRGA